MRSATLVANQEKTTIEAMETPSRKRERFLDHPCEHFLQTRKDFLILTQVRLEADILRLVEACTESAIARAKKDNPNLVVPADACLWVPIAQAGFFSCMEGIIQSKTTLTATIKKLKEKFLVFERPSERYHNVNEYMLNKPLIHLLFSLFPTNIDDIDMMAVMRHPRKASKKGGQKLTPSPVHPLIQKLRDATKDPQNKQFLTPPPSIFDTHPEHKGGQKLTPKRREKKDTEKEKKEAATNATPTAHNNPQPTLAATNHHILTVDINHITREVLLDLQQCLHSLLAKTEEQASVCSLACSPDETIVTPPDLQVQTLSSEEDELEQEEPADDGTSKLHGRSAPAVVKLIEELRGRPYTASERPRELRSAIALLNLAEAPQLSLEEIREAWEHGSDDWWRSRYGDDVHVHDLVLKDAHGKRRVLAFLEHKRRSARFATASDHAQAAPYVPVQDIIAPLREEPRTNEAQESYELLTCEADAVALASQIEHDGQTHGYDLVAHVEEDAYHPGVWFVDVEWLGSESRRRMHRVSSYASWQRHFSLQHAIIRYNDNAVPA